MKKHQGGKGSSGKIQQAALGNRRAEGEGKRIVFASVDSRFAHAPFCKLRKHTFLQH